MIVTVKNKQSLMDVTVENYGQIDNLVEVSSDNGKSISEVLETNEELTVNSENKGDQEIKDKITTQKLSFNNDVIPPPNFSKWFLPSQDELNQMYVNLHLFGVGGFVGQNYWTSSERNSITSHLQNFVNGTQSNDFKSSAGRVRACRIITDKIGAFSLRDEGPSGGLIFNIDSETYYEAAPSDQSASQVWSNITSTLIGTTGLLIGDGLQNTLDIINQAGHTDSAAKLCNDLSL
jgi:hypothetical protein